MSNDKRMGIPLHEYIRERRESSPEFRALDNLNDAKRIIVDIIMEERDRYREALASMGPLYLNADEPEACPVHQVQLYDAIAIPRVHDCAWVEARKAADVS